MFMPLNFELAGIQFNRIRFSRRNISFKLIVFELCNISRRVANIDRQLFQGSERSFHEDETNSRMLSV